MLPAGNFAGDFPQWRSAFERGYDNRRSGQRRRRAPRHQRQQFVNGAPVPVDYYYYRDDVGYYPEPWTMPESSGIHDDFAATEVCANNGRAPATGQERAGGSRGSSSSSSSSVADAAASGPMTARERRLLSLVNRTGYPMVQNNGQRHYGPPHSWKGDPPPKGCEVFVGKLPRDLFEDELVPFLERAGQLYEVRLMMDFAGSNRGFAFATYVTRREAQRAVRELDDREVRRGRRVGVCQSLDNCRLFVGGIPRDKNRDDVLEEMRRVTEGVVDVILYPNVADKTRNRGFAFVEYVDHKSAAVARRRMIPGKMTLWGSYEVAVDWAEPEPIVDEETMNTVTVLYVRNLMLSTSEDVIREAFTLEGQLTVAKIKKIRDFAFVHYLNREDAELALESMRGAEIEGSPIEVAWSKPVNQGKRFDRKGNYGKKGKVLYHGSRSNFRGDPVVMPPPVGGVGFGLYTLASHPVPLPIGAGRPGRGEGLMQVHNGVAPLPRPGDARATRCQMIIQVLTDVCERQGWGVPQFHLVTVTSSECSPESNGEPQMPLYFFKVTLPNISPPLYNTITPNKFSCTIEEAREYAAEYALYHLLQRLDMATPAQYPHPTSPVFVATPTLPAIGQGYPQYGAVLPGAGSPAITGPPWQHHHGNPPPPPPPPQL